MRRASPAAPAVLRRHPTAWVNILLAVLIVGAEAIVFVLLDNNASAVVGDVTASVSGTVDAATTKNLTSPAAGRITAVDVNVGDQVQAGQLLAQVDPTAADASMASAKAAVTTAQAALDQTTFDRDQADTIYADDVARYADDSTTLQQARLDRETTRAAQDAAQAALTKAQAGLFDASVARCHRMTHARARPPNRQHRIGAGDVRPVFSRRSVPQTGTFRRENDLGAHERIEV
jgi:multidrug efflux pump subunit AcrA (membrane-fusion protein)